MSNKKVLITGATGMIGRPLSAALIARGYEVIVLSRNPQSASLKVPGAAAYYSWTAGEPGEWVEALNGARAVISLAGAIAVLFGNSRVLPQVSPAGLF